MHLVIISRQRHQQFATFQRGIGIDVAEVEFAHIGIGQTGCGIERGGGREEVKATSVGFHLTRKHRMVVHRHIVVHHQIAESQVGSVSIGRHHIAAIQIDGRAMRVFGFQFGLQGKVICHIPQGGTAVHHCHAWHFQMQLAHIECLKIAISLQLHFKRTHGQLPVQHRTDILRVGTSHTGEIDDIALPYLSFTHQGESARVHIIEGIHVHAICHDKVTVTRLHVELGNCQGKRIHLHPTLRFCNRQSRLLHCRQLTKIQLHLARSSFIFE